MIDPMICLTFFGLENRLTKPKALWFQFPPTKLFLTCSSILTSNITLCLKLQKGNFVDFSGIHFFGVKTLKTFNELSADYFVEHNQQTCYRICLRCHKKVEVKCHVSFGRWVCLDPTLHTKNMLQWIPVVESVLS